jgi:hypothetical protein
MDKEKQIASIKQRILDEHRKHRDLDWAEIAARKIYSNNLVKNCSIPAVSCSLPSNSEFWEEWNKHQDIQKLWLWMLRRQ